MFSHRNTVILLTWKLTIRKGVLTKDVSESLSKIQFSFLGAMIDSHLQVEFVHSEYCYQKLHRVSCGGSPI